MDAYIGEIRIFAGNFAPRGWALCDGTSMPIVQNQVLYSIIGVTYGGDGKTYFNLPDLRDQAPMHAGVGTGLTGRTIGSQVGSPSVTLDLSQVPSHNHIPQGSSITAGTSNSPENAVWVSKGSGPLVQKPYKILSKDMKVMMNDRIASSVGGNQPHNNKQPFLAMNYIICVEDGIYPQKS